MNSNELREYVKRLNEQEAVIIEQRRQAALKKIKEMRQRNKYTKEEHDHVRDVVFK